MVLSTEAALITSGPRSPPSQHDAPDLQHEVQRLVGRCLLRLQQYETLIKYLVAHHQLSGPAYALERIRVQRVKEHATKPLGYQIDVLLRSFFTTSEAPHTRIDDASPLIGSPAFGYRSTMRLSAEDYARTKAELRHLVDARNDLVHDFGSRFDLHTCEGCSAACDYLEGCYARIDTQYGKLCAWVKGVDAARIAAAAFMQAPGLSGCFNDGAEPVATTRWAEAEIVGALREAAALNAGERGWTRLDHAIALIHRKHPGLTPDSYGCKSWRHVLNESRRFDLEYRADENARRAAWFKVRDR
ncbi:OST-HTH/LOTUS domain-containing protein [Ralstonia sp. SET104]|jgi:hypothetical protein|uniref:OST-HTH/LOTUS domain-containing protein n=1 Tax=Ralstonia sp. SET104 TaxID=2448774 RepID=UPI000FF96891|nr:OST-HTH/LOTUS domain-containing protein [Ralstonia sp. SET104]GCB05365.1 hypothetical protein PSUB009319_29960 [Ralstonia sp. SET104]